MNNEKWAPMGRGQYERLKDKTNLMTMTKTINRIEEALQNNWAVEASDIRVLLGVVKEIQQICEDTTELNPHNFTKRQAIECDRALTDILLLIEGEKLDATIKDN